MVFGDGVFKNVRVAEICRLDGVATIIMCSLFVSFLLQISFGRAYDVTLVWDKYWNESYGDETKYIKNCLEKENRNEQLRKCCCRVCV